ncbi:MAG: UDP-N-acetylmuramate dehydrogenase [Patescibacteria group bacterium]|nr:UDP-N-acetylmuramate dehydrogenase [Patescibacteria group bacterium]MDD4610844.1 UDP-N-acetylmuramate dehydrogenase [Patescibacteria group bacterium]
MDDIFIAEKIKQNFSLVQFAAYKVGGPAEFFLEVKTKEDLVGACMWAKEKNKEIKILGGGSNILICDQGIKGLVLKIANSDTVVRGERLDCGAGANLNRAMYLAAGAELSGLEWSAGIPGATIGGAVRGNAGAFSMSMSDIVETVEAFNLSKNNFNIFSNKDCRFSYRQSYFSDKNDYLIWRVILKMRKGNKEKIEQEIERILFFRQSKQPRLPSAGSVFKNIDLEYLESVNKNLSEEAISSGAMKDGRVAAGWLVDLAGLKGKKIGGAKVSLEHANFIVNTGNATAEDIFKLINIIKNEIKIRFKVELKEEIQYIGF